MKQIGFTLMLFVVVLSPLAAVCQGLPNEPAPQVQNAQSSSSSQAGVEPAEPPSAQPKAPFARPDAAWRKIQQIPHGEPIVVNSTLGPALQCRFARANNDTLFCDAPEAPDGTGYRFDRAAVITVEMQRPEKNYHPAWLASMIAGGLAVGLIATQGNDAADSARIGAVGALVVGAIGAPLAFLQPDSGSVMVVYRPHAFRIHGRGPLRVWPRGMR